MPWSAFSRKPGSPNVSWMAMKPSLAGYSSSRTGMSRSPLVNKRRTVGSNGSYRTPPCVNTVRWGHTSWMHALPVFASTFSISATVQLGMPLIMRMSCPAVSSAIASILLGQWSISAISLPGE